MGKCVICGNLFRPRKSRGTETKTCSTKCGKKLGEKTSGKSSPRLRHGGAVKGQSEKLYGVWCDMKKRCYCPTANNFNYYGGRGIYVCDEWVSNYGSFRDWALNAGYQEGLWIERIDNNGIYSPSNCKWATIKEQANNRSTARMITCFNKTQTVAKWAEETGINPRTIKSRLYVYGWDTERALTIHSKKHNYL